MQPSSKKRPSDVLKRDENPSNLKPPLKQAKQSPSNKNPSKSEKKSTKSTPWHQNQQFLTKFIGIKKQFSIGTGQINTDSLLICSWNINGIRAIMAKNELQNYFNTRKPDILCLSETKTCQESLEKDGLTKWIPPEYTHYFNCSRIKKGYSGTAVITRYKPLSVEYGMGVEKFDAEGRVINLEFEKFYLVACYVPMSGDDFSKLPMRINEWDPAFREHLAKLKAKKEVIVCGDLNIVHKDIDIWAEMGKWAGTSNEERKNFDTLLETGFVDSFRYKHPNVVKYSWWSTYLSQRPLNRGRRYDYILVSKGAEKGIKDAFIDNDVHGSDHCPVELLFNPNFDEIEDDKKPEEKQNTVENKLLGDSQPVEKALEKLEPSGDEEPPSGDKDSN